jgi:hypothetical protein
MVAAVAALLIVNAGMFLPYQSLWLDETTQIGGIRLGAMQVLPWLAGRGPDLGVPDDCAPPVSYLLQIGWGAAFGTSESALRWFGVVCAYVGVLFAAAAARRAFGRLSAVAAALFLASSPNVMMIAVEIRSYAVFFMLACTSTYLLIRVLQSDATSQVRWIAALTTALLAAIYTHYFGVVLAGACFLALLFHGWRTPIRRNPTLGFAVVLVVGSIGLLPFLGSALEMTRSFGAANAPAPAIATSPGRSVLQLGYRFFAHPAMAGSSIATALTLAGALIAGAVALTPRRAGDPLRVAVLVALGGGLGVVVVAAFTLTRLRATVPTYNVWALPLIALLLARSVSIRRGSPRRLGAAGVVLLVAGSLLASLRVHRHPDAYAHGPQRRIFELLGELGPENSMVVYDRASTAAGHMFFPIRHTFGHSLPQYVAEGADARLVPYDPLDPVPSVRERRFAIVLRPRVVPATELARDLEQSGPPPGPIETAESLKQQGWRSVSIEHRPSLMTTDIEVLERPR